MFDQNPAEVRSHVDENRLLFEARAEMNALEKREEEDFEAWRSVAEKVKKVVESRGLHGVKHAAGKMKIGERQVRNLVNYADSHPDLPAEQKRAILWGYGGSAKKTNARERKPVTAYSHAGIWSACNRSEIQTEAMFRDHGLLDDPRYKDAMGHLESHRQIVKAVEKEIGK
jgi:hypothetical protein